MRGLRPFQHLRAEGDHCDVTFPRVVRAHFPETNRAYTKLRISMPLEWVPEPIAGLLFEALMRSANYTIPIYFLVWELTECESARTTWFHCPTSEHVPRR